jgi:hypothetical protein
MGHRLEVFACKLLIGFARTEDSQSSNPGSIPGSATKFLPSPQGECGRDVLPEAAFK